MFHLVKTFSKLFAFYTTVVPFLWGEGAVVSYFLTITRYVLMLNATWAVNSFAHLYGDKPYDKSINPSENTWVSLFAVGEC